MKRPSLDLFVVDITDSVQTAMERINENKHRAVLVLDHGRVVGVVSDGDVRRAFLRAVLPIAPVSQVMNLNFVSTEERDQATASKVLRSARVTVLPIVDGERQLLDIVLAYEPTFEPGGGGRAT